MLDGGGGAKLFLRWRDSQLGIDCGFHLAAAEIYGRLAAFKDSAAPPPLDEVTEALRHGGPKRALHPPLEGEGRARSARGGVI